MAHERSVLQEFLAGEVRLIYARRRATGKLYLLPDGEADARRAWAREWAVCPIPSCDSPALTTVNRGGRGRDGFRHTVDGAGGHAGEGVFHVQAAEMIALYLRASHPEAKVTKEEASDQRRSRVADVMITLPDEDGGDGRRVAFEIQYAGLQPGAWDRRHDSYAEQEIPDVWLFGHSGDQLRPARGQGNEGRVTISPVHRRAGSGHVTLWVNPLTEQIATVIDQVTIGDVDYEIPAAGKTGLLIVMPLTDFRLDTGVDDVHRFTSDRVEKLLADALVVRAHRDAEEARARAVAEWVAREAAAETERLRAAAARAADEEAAKQSAWAAIAAAAARLEPTWLTSGLRLRLLEHFDGVWPDWLDVNLHPGLPIPVQQWQGTLYAAFIMGAPDGTRITPGACAELLGQPGDPDTTRVIRRWFAHLIDERRLTTTKIQAWGGASIAYLTVDQGTLDRRDADSAAWQPDVNARLCLTCREPLADGPDLWRGTHRGCD